jgi:Kef-type K+ transport system membrane component KefB
MSITAFPVLARILEDRGLAGSPLGALVLSAGALDDLAAWAVVCGLVWTFKAEATLVITAAFVAGLFLPRSGSIDKARAAVDPVSNLLALPVYFAYSGLNTRFGLVSGAGAWSVFALILGAAVVGKGGACWLAARIEGRTNGEAFAIGALMNSRGLMELIILNMGLEHGLITPLLFTMMALMAVATTILAAPLYEWSRRLSPASAAGSPAPSGSRT